MCDAQTFSVVALGDTFCDAVDGCCVFHSQLFLSDEVAEAVTGGPRGAIERRQSHRPSLPVIPSSSISTPQRWQAGGFARAGLGWGRRLPRHSVQPSHSHTSQRASASCILQFGLMKP